MHFIALCILMQRVWQVLSFNFNFRLKTQDGVVKLVNVMSTVSCIILNQYIFLDYIKMSLIFKSLGRYFVNEFKKFVINSHIFLRKLWKVRHFKLNSIIMHYYGTTQEKYYIYFCIFGFFFSILCQKYSIECKIPTSVQIVYNS